MFLKLGDIRGDSTHPSFMGWISLDYLSRDSLAALDPDSGQPVGRRGFAEVTVKILTSHRVMRALTKALVEGTDFPTANVVTTGAVRRFYSFEGVKLSNVTLDESYTRYVQLTVSFSYKNSRADENTVAQR